MLIIWLEQRGKDFDIVLLDFLFNKLAILASGSLIFLEYWKTLSFHIPSLIFPLTLYKIPSPLYLSFLN